MNSFFINFPQAVFKSRIKWRKKYCNIRVLACWVCDAFWSQSRWSSDWSVGGAVTCVLPRHPHCLTWLAIRIEYSRNDSRLCHVSQIKWQKKKQQVVKVFIWCSKNHTGEPHTSTQESFDYTFLGTSSSFSYRLQSLLAVLLVLAVAVLIRQDEELRCGRKTRVQKHQQLLLGNPRHLRWRDDNKGVTQLRRGIESLFASLLPLDSKVSFKMK